MQFLAEVVDRWHRRPEVLFSDVVEKGKPVVRQIKEWAGSQKLKLPEFWKVGLAKRVKQRALDVGPSHFDDETIEKWQRLFAALIDVDGAGPAA